jgi:hypothetical protein
MSAEESTLVATKSSFLRAQVRILSQPLKPSAKWKEGSDFSENELNDVMRNGEPFVFPYIDASCTPILHFFLSDHLLCTLGGVA